MTYILLDASNMFFRGRHVSKGDIDIRLGMALHIMFTSIYKCWRRFKGDHVVACFEGGSWREEIYPQYKAKRKLKKVNMTPTEQEEDMLFFEAFDSFKEFLRDYTNISVLQSKRCEADDFIARWIHMHPDADHVIISSDSDFYQLLNNRVSQYNGIMNHHITVDGIFDDFKRSVIDAKTGNQKKIGDPEWLLFEKCIRGDSSDNIFPAYPGARKKGTKNKTGLIDAFNDRHKKSFDWNNFFMHQWDDHEGVTHVVKDDYERNKKLIDLSSQPDDVKQILDNAIVETVQQIPKKNVGLQFMKFCGKWNLLKIGEQASEHTLYLNAKYR